MGKGAVFVGDFNGTIPNDGGLQVSAKELNSGGQLNGNKLLELCHFDGFSVLNRHPSCTGRITRAFKTKASAIDIALVNGKMLPFVTEEIFDQGTIQTSSDHNFMLVRFSVIASSASKPKQKQLGWNFNEKALTHYHSNVPNLLSFYGEIWYNLSFDSLKTLLLTVTSSTPGIRARYPGRPSFRKEMP